MMREESADQEPSGGGGKRGFVTTPVASSKLERFPFLDLQTQFNTIKDEIMRAATRVLESQQFILGSEVESFEKEVAAFVGTRYAIGCASGSDALLLALLALGIGPGDEVITTPFTFVATAGSVTRTGAKPVFVDIERSTYSINPALIEPAITKRTRAIIPVHLFGLAADLDPTLELAATYKLEVIEDAAQAIRATYRGAYVGSLGTLGCFSFFPSKNLGGAGDGGIIATNRPELTDRLRMLRVHGSRKKYHYEVLGINSRLDALQAAILRVKLAHLPAWTKGRQQRAALYRQLFAEFRLDNIVGLPAAPSGREHVFNQFVVRCPERDRLREFLRQRGIPTEIYYPRPLHLQPAFAYLGYKPGQLRESEAASQEVLALPIYPELKEEHQATVVRATADFYGGGT